METKEQQQQSETKEMTDSTEHEGKRGEDTALDAGQEEAQETGSQEPSFQELYEESLKSIPAIVRSDADTPRA